MNKQDHEEEKTEPTKIHVDKEEIKGIALVTTDALVQEIKSGSRTYMDRSTWPMQVTLNGEAIVDSKQMRDGYVILEELLKSEVSQIENKRDAVLALRFNIPMNPGVAFFKNNEWVVYPQEIGTTVDHDGRLITPWMILINPKSLIAVPNTHTLSSDQNAITSTILGYDGRFQEEAFISTTYDPRHIIKLDYKFPPKRANGEKNTFDDFLAVKDEPANKTLTGFTQLFFDKDKYIAEAKSLINEYGWSTYDRTVVVISSLEPNTIELYKFYKTAPPKIVETIMKRTEIKNPVIFGMTEGGSFGAGCIFDSHINELGTKKDYTRGPQGMMALAIHTSSEIYSRIRDANEKILH
ncbi:MAG: hypothetical protein HQK65_20500 [Desulfamplus sp.]|nr:hypothetical protein [Desulfamplus sp.]